MGWWALDPPKKGVKEAVERAKKAGIEWS
jgi:hypothetical protein